MALFVALVVNLAEDLNDSDSLWRLDAGGCSFASHPKAFLPCTGLKNSCATQSLPSKGLLLSVKFRDGQPVLFMGAQTPCYRASVGECT